MHSLKMNCLVSYIAPVKPTAGGGLLHFGQVQYRKGKKVHGTIKENSEHLARNG